MNEIVTILKDEYVRLKALEEDLSDLQSVSKYCSVSMRAKKNCSRQKSWIVSWMVQRPFYSGESTATSPSLNWHAVPR